MQQVVEQLIQQFQSVFSQSPRVFRSPGRINLIGEHTDYNDGFVLPAAIEKSVYIAVAPRSDNRIELISLDYQESRASRVDDPARTGEGWPDYILGVVQALKKAQLPIQGFNIVVGSDLPVGAGLSSSAALTCATVYALNEMHGWKLPGDKMIRFAQQAEHEYAGVLCGIMDQFASMFGRKDCFVRLDCRSMEYTYFPFDSSQADILLLNSNVKHTLASSEYNTRRQECEQGLEWIRASFPDVHSLRDATEVMLDSAVLPKSALIDRRCRYVIRENERVHAACAALSAGDMNRVGALLYETHDGLTRAYEVSCPELDFLVDAVRMDPDVFGSRMMGGGFGGCTINLVRKGTGDRIAKEVAERYQRAMGKSLTPILVALGEGTREWLDA